MDKFAVQNVRKMQQDALGEVRGRLGTLRGSLRKTAADEDELAKLEQQEASLVEALAASD